MTNSNRQALIAAFTFGLVAHAGTAALFLIFSKRASKIIRDAPRLALVAFLISSALWAQIDFASFLLNIDSKSGCQVMVTFASIFDQFARVSIQQGLLWIFSTHSLASLTEIAIMQGFLVLRLLLGGVFVGIQRPQMAGVCLTMTSIVPVGITVSVVDTAFVAFLLMRIISRGNYSDTQKGSISPGQSRAAALIVLGLVIWTGTSAPLMMSIGPMPLIIRTTLPSIGLLILIGIVTLFHDQLFADNSKPVRGLSVPDFDNSRDFHSRQMTTTNIHGSSYHDDFTRTAPNDFTRSSDPLPPHPDFKQQLPMIAMPAAGQANVGMGGVPVLGQLFPLPKNQTVAGLPETEDPKRSISRETISTTSRFGTTSHTNNSSFDSTMSTKTWSMKSEDRDASTALQNQNRNDSTRLAEPQYSSSSSEPTMAATTSAFLSPGADEVRRRSPRQSPRHLPSPALSIFPRSTPVNPPARTPTKAMADAIVNFSLPVVAQVPHPYHEPKHQPPKSAPLAAIPRSNASEILSKREDSARTLSVVHRPRPIPRKSSSDRVIFPTEGSPSLQNHKRSQSCGTMRLKQPLDTPADINYDLSRLNEFANVLAANVPTPSKTSRSARRRSRSMVNLPMLPVDLELKPKPDEAKPRIDNTEALADSSRTPASLVPVEKLAQSPKSPRSTTIHLPEEPLSATSSSWWDPQAKGYGRRSSPILPIEDLSALTPTTIRDEDFTMEADIRSPAKQVHVQRALTVTVMSRPHQRSGLGVAETPLALRDESRQGPLPLTMHKPSSVQANVVGFGAESQRAEELQATAKQQQQHFWPSQVGAARPTFSDRGNSTRPRRNIPPTPLVLRRTDVFTEPSPVESEDSLVETTQKDIDSAVLLSYQIAENDRQVLLTNLEQELTEQESQWHTIRHTMLVRDSLSTVGTSSPSRDSRYGYGSARLSFAARLAQRGTGQFDGDYDILPLFPHADLKSKTKLTASSNFPRFTAPLATPTPPDTDEESEYDEDHEALIGQERISPAKAAVVLWRPIVSVKAVTSRDAGLSLWTPASRPTSELVVENGEFSSANVSMRRPVRKDVTPLVIQSSRLWERVEPKTETAHHRGLWQSTSQIKTQVVEVKAQPKPPRNPPRRIRRVTLLPDILESPKPLPDRRGTLGIFQFPWGDRSDCATVRAGPLGLVTMSSRVVQPDVAGGMQMQNHGLVSEFDMDDYEQDDGDYYDDSSETYDSDDEDYFGFELAQPVTQATDKCVQATPLEKILASHEDGTDPRAISGIDTDVWISEHAKTFEIEGEEQCDKDSEQAATRTQHNGDGDYSIKADVGAGAVTPTSPLAVTMTPTHTPTDMDLRGDVSEKNLIRVRRQPQIGQIGGPGASISMPVPQMARCLLMDMGQAQGGAPINDDDSTHGTSIFSPVASKSTSDPCTSTDMSRGASSAGHPQPQAQLLFRFLEGSISKPADVDVDAALRLDLDCDSPSPLPLSPLVIYKSDAPTARQQTLVINLLIPSLPTPASYSQSQSLHQHTTTKHQTSSMALWTPSTPVSRPNKGLPQPDDSTWNAYLPTGEVARLVPAKADLPTIESSSLWVASPKKVEPTNFGLWGTKQPLPGMWTHPIVSKNISYGLPQPDDSTWSSYLPTGETARLLPAKADMPSIESNALWTAPVKKAEHKNFGLWGTKQPLPGMWTHSPISTKTSYGLPQPDAETWATYLIVEDDATRVKPREAESVFLDSTSLWTPAKPVISEAPSEDGLWSGSSSAPSVSGSEPSTPSEAVNFGLWEAPISVFNDEEPAGLFSLSHQRTDYRTTKMAPAAQGMERAPRRPLEAFPDFGFSYLWNMAPLWDSKANAAAIKLEHEIDSLVLEGLFSLNHRRNNFRTTPESPAALDTRPKQRISQQSLPKLTSDSLWSVRASNQDLSEVNWLALSTVRPRAASVASSTDSEFVPALTRANSINSERPRPAATPIEWLAALEEAIELGSDKTLGMEADVDNYQLWSKPGADVDEPVIASDELWRPMNTRFLELTPTLSEFDKQHAESGTSQRGRTQKARPPLPLYPGSSSSAFLPGAGDDTPRDFSSQALWARSQSPAPEAREAGPWMDKSRGKGLSFMQLW
ncbi:hypothetical protein KAF25_001071 [Fusarium avenaceum]|uniref:Uncharacterized protein n=1 Tax=Fusarium avenaceum TaxID=40199 RepID=A0A9P7KVW3_9HYPO|nr:hypothetical protein KAF25_001071 [Fusarium avenaceum]